jgi:Xaa-Pro aminopeptidase
MFPSDTYTRRRRALLDAEEPSSGIVLLLGNEPAAMNYRGNPYPFRQDSTFLYYFGLDEPGLDGIIDLDAGTSTLYGDDPSLDDVVWMGERPSMQEYASRAGIEQVRSQSDLGDDIEAALEQGRPVHFLPPYRARHAQRLEALVGVEADRAEASASEPLLQTVVRQRSVKSDEEVEQLELALEITARIHRTAMRNASPGRTEREIAGELAGIAEANGQGLSFRPTCSIHGEVLHNHEYGNQLQDGDLLLVDAGAASPLHYAGDVTRVSPVGGTFTSRQRDIYQAVLDAQRAALETLAPGVPYREVHLEAARVLTDRLVQIGLMSGPVDEAVDAGAHALFFPHGLGHMLGLDAHDMENLGEDRVGYAEDQDRSEQFGLHTLRLARPLREGFVVTVEPGCYFIPELIRQWRQEDRHAQFIDYEAVSTYEDFGGIRIEDDALITDEGARILGPDLPKAPSEVENEVGRSG